ncbi:type 11 methyltransferase [Dyella mobilis]|nr:type 11 methyltransferase [Dyella mobilis]
MASTANVEPRIHYGIDAPGVFRANIILGVLFASAAAAGLLWLGPTAVSVWLCAGAALLATLLFYLAGVMLWSSLVGKMRVRDRLVSAMALAGHERVLDAGCGNGLALIACAKKLTTGQAVGVDVWTTKDLSNNTPAATLANAAAAGVADRVDVKTGDITRLPFPDASFDVVVSMTVIHNISSQALRDQALCELVRVLKPGGRIAVFDLRHGERYAEVLQRAGLTVRDISHDRLWLLSGRSLLAQKTRFDSKKFNPST